MKKATAGLKMQLLMLAAACIPLHAGQSEAAAPQTAYILVLRVTTNGTVHSIVESRLVPSPVALSLPPPVADGRSLNYAVADARGRLVFEAGMPNPREVRSPLPPPGEPAKGHETVVLPQVEYVIRMPYDRSASTLQIAVGVKPVLGTTSAASAGAIAPPPPGAQNFNLQSWVRAAEVKADLR